MTQAVAKCHRTVDARKAERDTNVSKDGRGEKLIEPGYLRDFLRISLLRQAASCQLIW